MSMPTEQPNDVVSPTMIVGLDEAALPLGLLAGKAKEAPDCWDPCEEVEQLFYGVRTSQG